MTAGADIVLAPAGGVGIPAVNGITRYTGPAGGTSGFCLAETFPRWNGYEDLAIPSGDLVLTAVYLPAGVTMSKLGWVSGATAAVTPTHQWMGLYDDKFNQLATTADGTTSAIAAHTAYQYDIAETASGAASSFTTTYSGRYYIGILVVASTMPTAVCCNIGSGAITDVAPVYLCYGSGYSSPPSFPNTVTYSTGGLNIYYMWAS